MNCHCTINFAGRWCEALRKIVREGYCFTGADVSSPNFAIETQEPNA